MCRFLYGLDRVYMLSGFAVLALISFRRHPARSLAIYRLGLEGLEDCFWT